jgi:hypothetical protein
MNQPDNQLQVAAMLATLTTDEVRGMTLLAATELARRWEPKVPNASDHIIAGAGVLMEITLKPEPPSLILLLVGTNGARTPLARFDYDESKVRH